MSGHKEDVLANPLPWRAKRVQTNLITIDRFECPHHLAYIHGKVPCIGSHRLPKFWSKKSKQTLRRLCMSQQWSDTEKGMVAKSVVSCQLNKFILFLLLETNPFISPSKHSNRYWEAIIPDPDTRCKFFAIQGTGSYIPISRFGEITWSR